MSVIDWKDWLTRSDEEILMHCKVENFKGSGKGGQKRNKTSNGVRLALLRWKAEESNARSREENLRKALGKLKMTIALDLTERVRSRPEVLPSYVQGGLIRINEKNPQIYLVLGETLDLLLDCDDHQEAAEFLGVTKSQLNRFLEKWPALKQILHDSHQTQKWRR